MNAKVHDDAPKNGATISQNQSEYTSVEIRDKIDEIIALINIIGRNTPVDQNGLYDGDLHSTKISRTIINDVEIQERYHELCDIYKISESEVSNCTSEKANMLVSEIAIRYNCIGIPLALINPAIGALHDKNEADAK